MSILQFTVNGIHAVRPTLETVELTLRDAFAKGLPLAVVSLTRDLRSSEQNRLMWPLLTDWSKQVTHIDGRKYSPDQWKDILTAAFEGVTQYAPNLDGSGLIAFGSRTSKYSKKKFSEFIEFLFAEGSQRGINWSEKSSESVMEVRG